MKLFYLFYLSGMVEVRTKLRLEFQAEIFDLRDKLTKAEERIGLLENENLANKSDQNEARKTADLDVQVTQ